MVKAFSTVGAEKFVRLKALNISAEKTNRFALGQPKRLSQAHVGIDQIWTGKDERANIS